MPRAREAKEPEFIFVEVLHGHCVDREAGKLWRRFASGRTGTDETFRFRHHMLDCMYCQALVGNYVSTCEASEYYGIPVGPELDKKLKRVTMDQDMAGVLMKEVGHKRHAELSAQEEPPRVN
jgi:hypothetical protein